MSPLDQRSTPNIFAPLGDCSRALHPLVQLTVVSRGSALIPPVTPRPHRGPRTITRNHFKDRRLTPQITTILSSVLCLAHMLGNFAGGHPSYECPTTSTLNCGVLKSGLLEKKGASLVTYVVTSNPFIPHSVYYRNILTKQLS